MHETTQVTCTTSIPHKSVLTSAWSYSCSCRSPPANVNFVHDCTTSLRACSAVQCMHAARSEYAYMLDLHAPRCLPSHPCTYSYSTHPYVHVCIQRSGRACHVRAPSSDGGGCPARRPGKLLVTNPTDGAAAAGPVGSPGTQYSRDPAPQPPTRRGAIGRRGWPSQRVPRRG